MITRVAILVLLLGGGPALLLGPVEDSMADDVAEEGADALSTFDSLWDHADPAATEARFRALLPRARKEGTPDTVAQLLSQIARTRALQRDFDGAHALLDEAEQLLTPACTTARIRIWLERGRAFNSSGRKAEASPLFLEAFVTAHRVGGQDGLMVDAVHMLGIVAEGASSVSWNTLAIDLAEKSEDPRAKRWLGSLYNNIGWSHHDLGEFEKALDYWQRGVAWHEERKTGETLRIARWAVSRALRSLGRYDEALERQRALLAEYDAAGIEESGYCAEEIGELLLSMDRGTEARPWFSKAYEKLSKDPWLAANEGPRLARMKSLAGLEEQTVSDEDGDEEERDEDGQVEEAQDVEAWDDEEWSEGDPVPKARGVEDWIEVLREGKPLACEEAVEALAGLGREILPQLEALLEDPDPDLVVDVRKAIRRIEQGG